MYQYSLTTGVIIYSFLRNDLIPQGFLICDGKEYSKIDYQDLYTRIQNIYGNASSQDNFKVPNLINRYIKSTIDKPGIFEDPIMAKHNHPSTITIPSGAHKNKYITINTRWVDEGSSGSQTKWRSCGWQKLKTPIDGAHSHSVEVQSQGTSTGNLNSYAIIPLIKY